MNLRYEFNEFRASFFENLRGGCFCAFNEFCKTNNLEIILIKAFTTNETARLFSNNTGSQHVFKEN